MKTAIYARVSTTNGQDPEMQLRELREYCRHIPRNRSFERKSSLLMSEPR
jgi:DNA invertase Pin-like site-specific DNA recombinase